MSFYKIDAEGHISPPQTLLHDAALSSGSYTHPHAPQPAYHYHCILNISSSNDGTNEWPGPSVTYGPASWHMCRHLMLTGWHSVGASVPPCTCQGRLQPVPAV
mmetsp:Transcript_1552/g.3513  ORF Transcript_1552/g.3513 Transcript_1552/m.3513 type:complete len:103 (+) Transcript_1552:185-493(+)